jgi:hypothetical protein
MMKHTNLADSHLSQEERLAAALREECYQELAWGGLWFDGERYTPEPATNDKPGDELVYVRASDNRRFLIEASVEVRSA